MSYRNNFTFLCVGLAASLGGFFLGRSFAGDRGEVVPSDPVAAVFAPILPSLNENLDAQKAVMSAVQAHASRTSSHDIGVVLRDWMDRAGPDTWAWALENRRNMSEEDWQWFKDKLRRADRIETTPEYLEILSRWSGSQVDSLLVLVQLNGNLSEDSLKAAVGSKGNAKDILRLIIAENPGGDWVKTADFIQASTVPASEKTLLANRALSKWSEKEGPEIVAAWLSEDRRGTEFNRAQAWIAADLYAKNPSAAIDLISKIKDPARRSVAIMEIATNAKSLQELTPVLELADPASRARITASF